MSSFEDILNASEWTDEEVERMLFGCALLDKHDASRSGTIYEMFFGAKPSEVEEVTEPVYSCEAHKQYVEKKAYEELHRVYKKRTDHFDQLFEQLQV